MSKFVRLTTVWVAILAASMLSYFVGSRQELPFVRRDPKFAIAVYEGPTPFDLRPALEVETPIFKASDVTDFEAVFVADPFILVQDGRQVLFFEALEARTNRGVICWAESSDGLRWQYGGVALREPYHLSYPQVFKAGDTIYMIPESAEDYSVSLYRAEEFPRRWIKVKTLLRGHYTDPSVVNYRGRWWMFANDFPGSLRLFSALSVEGPWTEHPTSPVVNHNAHTARCGGRILENEGRLYRFAQDDEPTYGSRLWAFEITDLSPTTYTEVPVPGGPLLNASGRGWNAEGMHQIDHVRIGNKWRAYVDGWSMGTMVTQWWRRGRH